MGNIIAKNTGNVKSKLIFAVGIIGLVIGIVALISNMKTTPKNYADKSQVQLSAEVKSKLGISDTDELTYGEIKTTKGTIQIVLPNKKMPKTIGNFVKLVNQKFYDGLTFHRVENWVIQTGDPTGTGRGGSGQTVPFETNPDLKNIRGAVGMARFPNDKNSATSQFYILKTDAPTLDGDYAIFAYVYKGMDIVDKIEQGDKVTSIRITQ